jgi:DNA-binding HxlR family transcriptional regulator
MRSYGQFCPVAKAAELFCQRWTALILRDLGAGATRFSQLRRGAPLASPTLLSQRLKELEAEGVIERRPADGRHGWTYHLTEAGRDFIPLVQALGEWGQRWSRRQLADREMSLTLLMWGLERRVSPVALGPGRRVVKLRFLDQREGARDWWFVNDGETAELCIDDPGYEVDLYLSTTVPDMIRVYRGDVPLSRAIARGRIEVHGTTSMQRSLPHWLGASPYAHIPPRQARSPRPNRAPAKTAKRRGDVRGASVS